MTRRRIRGSTQDDVRRHNLGTILTEVHRHGYRSRALLTAEMGLNRSTIGDLVAELTEAGIVLERSASARGGPAARRWRSRPARTVRTSSPSTSACVTWRWRASGSAATCSTASTWSPGVTGATWTSPSTRSRVTCAPPAGRTPRTAPAAWASGSPFPAWSGTMTGCCGSPPTSGGSTCRSAPGWGSGSTCPPFIANDADLGALAEHWRGVAVGHDHVVVVSGEIGIGGGILIGGEPLRGRGGYAGEIGHLRVNPDGRPCRCGSRGCLETEIGVDALLQRGRPAGRQRHATPTATSCPGPPPATRRPRTPRRTSPAGSASASASW